MKLIKICGHGQLNVSDEKPKSPRWSTFLAKSMRSSKCLDYIFRYMEFFFSETFCYKTRSE